MSNSVLDAIPEYLHSYTTVQSKDRYTAQDHAAWRYILRQSSAYFRDHAVAIYLEGLEKTGVTIEKIPLIEDMDRKLQELGWRAVPVEGFIPPAAFLDFQARRVLPIAFDMRSIEHLHYTPAPDIVHEAAGHAPILADKQYSEYITMYAAMAQKALFAKHDLAVYEAIRCLSDVKENPDCAPSMIAEAEENLLIANQSCQFISEAAKVARMNWWTVEYGLLGSLKHPKIYGAGLLSSVGESQKCLSDQVKKIRLSVDCVETPYNITEPQPQLFVADDISHLIAVLKEYEAQLAFRRGGIYGLREAMICQTLATVVLDSGVEISGILSLFDAQDDRIDFIKLTGPCQISVRGKELEGHGIKQHPHGFSSPMGRFLEMPERSPSEIDDGALAKLGIAQGKDAVLNFVSGFSVQGRVAQIQRDEKKRLQIIKWQEATVTRGSQNFFLPDWGDFDMVVGEKILSVYGGPADRGAYGGYDVGRAKTSPGRTSAFSVEEHKVIQAFAKLREMRERSPTTAFPKFAAQIAREFPDQWLLRLECLEILKQNTPSALLGFVQEYEKNLVTQAEKLGADISWLVKRGINLAY